MGGTVSKILDRAKAHFQGLPRNEIVVPEWGEGDQPLTVTWSALTMAEIRKIGRPNDDGTSATSSTMLVRAVIEKACDASGKRLFDEMEETTLLHSVDGGVVSRIGTAIMYGGGRARSAADQVDDAKNG